MHYVEPCPRCASTYVNDAGHRHDSAPFVGCAWTALFVAMLGAATGPVGFVLGCLTAAALLAVGVVASVLAMLQAWYTCANCKLDWCVYPWQRTM